MSSSISDSAVKTYSATYSLLTSYELAYNNYLSAPKTCAHDLSYSSHDLKYSDDTSYNVLHDATYNNCISNKTSSFLSAQSLLRADVSNNMMGTTGPDNYNGIHTSYAINNDMRKKLADDQNDILSKRSLFDSQSQVDMTTYACIGWTILATSALYVVFVKL